jgi:hypothetical protein
MLVIRDAQFSAFEESALAQFEERMLGYLAESFPRQSALLGRDRMRRIVALGRRRSAEYGLETEREIYFYLTLMLMLGSWFDEDPQLPWCAARLTDRSILHPPARLNRLHNETMEYLDRVAGENNEHLVLALVRIRVFDPASADEIPAERFEEEMVKTLSGFYPEKAAHQSLEATRGVVRNAAALAARSGLVSQKAVCLLAGLAFMLGSGFHRDPQFPWAEDALPPEGLADLDALQSGAMRFLEFGLS